MSQIESEFPDGLTRPGAAALFTQGLAAERELEYASHQVNSIEINGSFYSLQRPEASKAWHRATPDGFLFR